MRLTRRLALNIVLALLAASASCAAEQVIFARDTRVMLFSPAAGQWALATFGQTRPGSEFYFGSQLYRVISADRARVVPGIDAARLLEADLQCNGAARPPKAGDAVQVLDKDSRFTEHTLLASAPPGSTIRFQGKAYTIKADRSLASTAAILPPEATPLQRIEITASAWRHIADRHTPGGSKSAGTSVFLAGVDIRALIVNAQLTSPVLESNGLLKRFFEAGRGIGTDASGRKLTAYRVITTPSGKLVTAFPASD